MKEKFEIMKKKLNKNGRKSKCFWYNLSWGREKSNRNASFSWFLLREDISQTLGTMKSF